MALSESDYVTISEAFTSHLFSSQCCNSGRPFLIYTRNIQLKGTLSKRCALVKANLHEYGTLRPCK